MQFSFVLSYGGKLRVCRFLTLVIAASITAVGNSLVLGNDILSGSSIERAGLTADWFTQIQLGPGDKIVNLELQINEDITTRYYLIEYDGRVERISQNDLDAFGEPRGIEGAEAHANVRKEIILAELAAQRRPDVKVDIRAITLPKATIYAVDQIGKVTAIDADTGKHLWSTRIGNRRLLTSGIGASKRHVAVVNGSTVYCLSADNGKILWSQKDKNSPSAPPTVGEEFVFVPMITGRLNAFKIEEKGAYPKSYISFGLSVAQPLVTESTVSWATSDGYYAVVPLGKRATKYSLETGSSFVGGGAFDNGTFYVNTTEGSLFSIDESRGSVNWEYSTGDRLVSAPVVNGDSVYVFSAENRMHRIDAISGSPAKGWEQPISGVSRFVGLSKDKIYVLDEVDQLVALDLNTGSKLATVSGGRISLVLPNFQSDRLYVGNQRGFLQCLRETGNTYPVFHADETEKMMAKADTKKSDEAAETSAEDDPFAGVDDPFAADSSDDSDPFAAAADPEDDPFATDDDSGEDPFAAGDDDSSADDESDPFAAEDDGSKDGGSAEDDDDPFSGG